jgi:hypothetical protein
VEEIEKIHRGELPAQDLQPAGPWGREQGFSASQHRPIRVPVNAVQRPLTSFFESGPAQRPFGDARALAEAEEAQREEEGQPEVVPIDREAAATWIYPGEAGIYDLVIQQTVSLSAPPAKLSRIKFRALL